MLGCHMRRRTADARPFAAGSNSGAPVAAPRGSVGGERRPDEEVLHYVCARGRGGNEAFIAGGYHREYWR